MRVELHDRTCLQCGHVFKGKTAAYCTRCRRSIMEFGKMPSQHPPAMLPHSKPTSKKYEMLKGKR